MPLFEVPGWSVPSTPVAESSRNTTKKRKRPLSNTKKLQSADVDLDKLVDKLKVDGAAQSICKNKIAAKKEKRRDGSKKKYEKKSDGVATTTISCRPVPSNSNAAENTNTIGSSLHLRKKTKNNKIVDEVEVSAKTNKRAALQENSPADLTPLQLGMKQSLDGARFRLINETLYKSDSKTAHDMMKGDPRVYEEYHTGFRHQVQLWPTNPVDQYVKVLSKYPKQTVIADLGCGDATLARALVPQNLIVLSFDLVSNNSFVIEADTCSKIPLPGSEGSETEKCSGEGHIIDVVVCSLSLMGTNWPKCIREAWRILKPGGELMIAEVASRFTDVHDFQSLVCSIGFQCTSRNDNNTHFTVLDFTKIARKWRSEKEWSKIMARGCVLKPCEYKRR